MGGNNGASTRNVTAVLGPTNTGKTHLAIERMLGHESGMIGLPLRLLAREVYDKIGNRIGFDKVALITGEEKIKPEKARYWVSTVEAMPLDIEVSFLAIDEVQLAADPERGHVFTDRLLHMRGSTETLLLGAQTMRSVIEDIIPGANFISRPRLSQLTYAGSKKITRLPPRSAIVAFSANEVYSLAELIRRQSGGAAVVLGALSPRTRNAQVGLYQSGEVDYLVATDAIGMGLNLNLNHVAFAALRKFDGHTHRELNPAELAQIAGRAGRHLNDGTFGVTAAVEPLGSELINCLENHEFAPVKMLQWRNRDLEFNSIENLKASLRETPGNPRLIRARPADDVEILELVSRDDELMRLASTPDAIARLWDVCQIPDYRKISLSAHAELVSTIYRFLMGPKQRIEDDWFESQVAFSANTDGDIDTLSNRIAHIRTWTFVSNRANWLADPLHWQQRTRNIEDKLSDALHERLTQRFVDARTSALMKGMRDKDELSAKIADDGAVHVEGHFIGRLDGFRFSHDKDTDGGHDKAAKLAAAQVLSGELAMRIRRVLAAKPDAFKLSNSGKIVWRDAAIASIEPSDDLLKPIVTVIADDEYLAAPDREKIQEKLDTWLKTTISEKLAPLVNLSASEDVTGLARGIAFQLVENFGILKRDTVSSEITALDQPARAQLRRHGVRFGAFNIYIPVLLKPASAELAATLWAAKHANDHGLNLDDLPQPPRAGLTSSNADPKTPEAFYRAFGYQKCGPRVVRLDILERLADQIRPLLAWRAKDGSTETPPDGSTGKGSFKATAQMMSILGCSPEELGHVLTALGFQSERRPIQQPSIKTNANADSKKSDQTTTETVTETVTETATEKSSKPTGDKSTPTDPAPASIENASAEVASTEDVSTDNVTSEKPEVTASDDAPKSPETDSSDSAEPPKTTTQAVSDNDAKTEPKQDATSPKDEATSDEITYEEVWRPKRHKSRDSHQGRSRRRDKSSDQRSARPDSSPDTRNTKSTTQDRPPKNRSRKPGDAQRSTKPPRHRPGQKGGRGADRQANDRSQRNFQSRAPKNKAGPDPDSPFAALAALREGLNKKSPSDKAQKDKS